MFRSAGALLLSSLLSGVAFAKPGIPGETQEIPDMPVAITSFGAAHLDGKVYVYGGHSGEAHSYSIDTTLPSLWSYSGSGEWNELADASRSQGASLLPYQGKLIRIGGLQAANEAGEKENLVSLDEVGFFDPAANQWKPSTPMPAPRSSHDSVVVGDRIYVVGGWLLNGISKGAKWYDEMFVGQIVDGKITWSSVPQPFQIRANAVAAVDGKIYSVGGMSSEDGTTSELWIYDPETEKWSTGPKLPKGIMDGFGASACSLNDRIYVSAYMGIVYRLAEDGESWEEVGKLKQRRFFHRLTPFGSDSLMAIAGANRQSGHMADVELFPIP